MNRPLLRIRACAVARTWSPALLLALSLCAVHAFSESASAGRTNSSSVLQVDFSNPGLTPSRWSMTLHPDGSAHFHSDPGEVTATQMHTIEPGPVDRDVQLSPEFASRTFETVHHHKLFSESCESHLKVAFQGWKKIVYTGPDGYGICEFNYSKNKDIQALGDSFVAIASTIVEGARLELLLQHDPLGLDKEMAYLQEGAADGRIQQLGAIQAVLNRLSEDPDVMERVRRRARSLLVAASR